MSDASILEQAQRMHWFACQRYRGAKPDARLAYPFGTPDGMPEHVWRVSKDVLQALYNAAPPPYTVPNPKNGDDGTERLFGWRVIKDDSLPTGFMRLEPA